MILARSLGLNLNLRRETVKYVGLLTNNLSTVVKRRTRSRLEL